MSAGDEEDAELAALRTELASVEAALGMTLRSIFPGTNPDATEHDRLRTVIDSLRRVGEEIKAGVIVEVDLDD